MAEKKDPKKKQLNPKKTAPPKTKAMKINSGKDRKITGSAAPTEKGAK